MNKMQKNIKQEVAKKALKDINKIVQAENAKEKNEKKWAKVVVGFIFVVLLVLVFLSVN